MTERPFKSRPTERAKKLRREATPAERKLWHYLSNRQLAGHKFSRQMPVPPYICDFLCRSQRLVIELDGYSHEMAEKSDERRTKFLERQGYRVLRFRNEDIYDQLEGVLTEISLALGESVLEWPTPNPSRLREGNSEGTCRSPTSALPQAGGTSLSSSPLPQAGGTSLSSSPLPQSGGAGGGPVNNPPSTPTQTQRSEPDA